MADRPILFSASMVQALLREARQPGAGKTQTRRILRLPKWASTDPNDIEFGGSGTAEVICRDTGCLATLPLPFAAGDRLWVKETWQVARETLDYETGGEYDVFEWREDEYGDPRPFLDGDARYGTKAGLFYRADGEDENPSVFSPLIGLRGEVLQPAEIKWRPSLFLPRWASRLTLLVTDVRVERLQDISEWDAVAEGVELESADPPFHYVPGIWPHSITAVGVEEPGGRHAARSFAKLWGHINGPESWQANPWVVVVGFSVHARNIDQLAPIAEAAE